MPIINQTFQKQIINGQEVMVLIEEEIIPDIVVEQPTPTVEELQLKVEELQQQIVEVQAQLEILTGDNADPNAII